GVHFGRDAGSFQPFDEIDILRVAEPRVHAFGDAKADLGDVVEFLDACGGDAVDAAKIAGEDLCVAFADVADVDAVEQPSEPAAFACFDLIDEVGARLFRHPFESGDLI